MKCHYCDKELTKSKDQAKWDLSCPNTHCHIKLDKENNISEYRIYLYPTKDLKYTIECRFYYQAFHTSLASHTKTPNMVRNKKGQMIKRGVNKERKTLMKVDKQIPITTDDNGKLEVDKAFDKLKLYVLFS